MPLEIDEWDANDGDDVDYDATKNYNWWDFV